MICPYCAAEDRTSRIYPGATMATLMAVYSYYDEEGELHVDDPNTRTTTYECSNDHRWSESTRRGEFISRVKIDD